MAEPKTSGGAEAADNAANAAPEQTPAQKAAETREANARAKAVETAEKKARELGEADAQERTDNPNRPVGRAADPEAGGESFAYGHRDDDSL